MQRQLWVLGDASRNCEGTGKMQLYDTEFPVSLPLIYATFTQEWAKSQMPLTHWNKLYLRIGALPRKSRNDTRIKWFAQLPFSAYLRVWIQERQFHKQLAALVEGKGMHAKVGAGGGGQDRGKGKNLALPSKIQPSPLRKKNFFNHLDSQCS